MNDYDDYEIMRGSVKKRGSIRNNNTSRFLSLNYNQHSVIIVYRIILDF